ncbi:MAG: T9SS type A sorting domain-containing protein [Bacteroidales bacterium]|nr:T9SS type A sorting domain-containing protein [Bacteroidales bacterium]
MKKITLLLSFLLLVAGINAQNPGDFDTSFGIDGIAMTAIGNNFGMAYDMAVQADGKIILAGQARFGSYKYAMVRYNTDGSLDQSFGENGIVTTSIDISDFGKSVAIQADGKIVLSGHVQDATSYHAVVVRYNADGSIDTSFGTNGLSHLNMDNNETVVLQDDGKIVVAGFKNDNFGLARLNTDGSIDTSYGDAGYVMTVMTDPDGSNITSYAFDLAVQEDGKIIAAGFSYSYNTHHDVAVARYTTDGTLDATFADNGVFKADLGGWADFGTAVAVQDDGKIVISAHKEMGTLPGTPTYDGAIIRLNADGSYDLTFGESGVASFHLAEHATYLQDVVLQDDGSIYFTGQAVNYAINAYDIFVCKIQSDGTLDLTFADDGVKHMDLYGTDDNASSIALQTDGKILVGGFSTAPSGVYNFTAVRLHGDPQTEIPAVDVTFANVTTTTLDVTVTPNELTESFYFVIMTPEELAQWLPMYGTEAELIKAFGIHSFETITHHFTGLMPNTGYDVYSLSVGFDGVESPFQMDFVQTEAAGGSGEAVATIELSEITATSVRMTVTPNSETALFHDGLITKAYFTELGEEAAVELIKDNGWPLYDTDDWVWMDLESNTAYKAISIAQNANGEWGPATIEDFTTLVTSINSIEDNPLAIFPNPSQGQFEIEGENIQGASLRITDITGKEVYSATIINKLTPIDISHVNSGLYIIEIEKDNVRSTSKFLKQ